MHHADLTVSASPADACHAHGRRYTARMSATRDPALDALLHPFADGALRWPERRALFLRAREGAALHAIGASGFAANA